MTDTESNPLTEIWTRDENNWTIGYCITAVRGLGMVTSFLFSFDMCIHVNNMSTQCHELVTNFHSWRVTT